MRLLPLLFLSALCLSCSKREAPAGSAAKSPDSPQTESAPEEDESPSPMSPPPGAAPGPQVPQAAEPEAPRQDGLARDDDLSTLAAAEAAFSTAQTRLTTLVGAQGATPLAGGDGRCKDACRAFASLKRAADAICRLAGDADARCARAKRVVDEHDERLRACSCTP